jgi:hypothetical protein
MPGYHNELGNPIDVIPVTASATELDPNIRGLRADTDCTVTVKTTESGDTTRTMKFLAGETRYCNITHVTVISAGTLEGLV